MKSTIMEQLTVRMVPLNVPVDDLHAILEYLNPDRCAETGKQNGYRLEVIDVFHAIFY